MGSPDRWALAQLAKLLTPQARLRVSEWADAHRVLSAKSSAEPGRWVTARNPLLRAIMDSLGEDCPVPEVVAMKPSQFGGTEVATNWIGYIMGHLRTPKPTLIVVPTDRLLVKWVLQRLRPMVEGAACLRPLIDMSKSRDGTNRLDIIDYPGGILFLSPSNSAAALKSDSIRFVVKDECDEYPWDVGGRGDPDGLIASRQTAFPRRKTFTLSTPSIDGSSRVAAAYERSDQRRYHVCCPHCGERQTLEWEHLGWSQDLAQVWYTCAVNGCVIDERAKPWMLREQSRDHPQGGVWIAARPERSRDCHGYAWNALYAPIGLGYSWRELVVQWLAAQGDDAKLQGFVNERLGRTWQDQRTAIRVEDLSARAEPYPLREIPRGVGLITAGVDTQDDRLAVQIIGWGPGGTWWVLDYVELPGETGQVHDARGLLSPVYAALTDLLARPLTTAGGIEGRIEAVAHDMAGHSTEAVKAFVRQTRIRRYLAVLGSRHRLNVVLGGPRKTDYSWQGQIIKHGMRYHQVGTELAKDQLYEALRTDHDRPPAERRAHYPVALVPPAPEPSAYLNGLMSEVWNPKRQRYEPRRGDTRRNEPLDTWVYALAAAHHPEIRIDRLRRRDWEQRLRVYGWGIDPAVAPPPDPPQARPAAPAGTPSRRPPVPGAPAPRFGKEGWGL